MIHLVGKYALRNAFQQKRAVVTSEEVDATRKGSPNVALMARDPFRGRRLSSTIQRGRRGDRRETGADARF